MTTTIGEKHEMRFTDCSVAVVIYTDGTVDVNIVDSNGEEVSFSHDTWGDITKFVDRSIKVTDGS
jgi:hypothetical protein